MKQKPVISIVSPVFQGADTVSVLAERIIASFSPNGVSIEILLVDDGSSDQSWSIIRTLAQQYPQVRGIKLDKNYGQHTAIFAGLSQCSGEYLVVMDCDLQDPPESIPEMVACCHPDIDAVFARREKSYNTKMRQQFSNIFYLVLSVLTGTKLDASVANFGVYRKSVMDAVITQPPHFFYLPLIIRKLTKRTVDSAVPHAARFAGTSTYSIRRLLSLAIRVIIAQCACSKFLLQTNTRFVVAEDTQHV